jgi:hypothetical protein
MVSSICFPLGRFNCRNISHLLEHLDVPAVGSRGGQSSKAITSPHGSLKSPRVLVRFDHVAGFIVNANHDVPIRLAKVARFFQNSGHMKTTTLPLRNLMSRSPLRAFLLISFVLACFALSPAARAVCQEGCLTNQNTVLGDDALMNNLGGDNTAIGFEALQANTTGNDNTALGFRALRSNTTGTFNTATGFEALFRNTIGGGNTANGLGALLSNTTGNSNTAIGAGALQLNTTGSNNIAVGAEAGVNFTTGNNNIDIGNAGVAGESRTIRIGTKPTHRNTFIAGISESTVPGGVAVIVDADGHLGTTTSSACFKDAIKPMDKASEAILALKPVTFRYKKELDPEGIPQFGLVAEQVEKVDPDLVARDDHGKPYTVRYEAVNAMLLNEFLKEHCEVQELKSIAAKQEANAAKQEATIARQQKQIEALTAGLQKVSAQVEMSRPAPQTVVDNH